MSSFKEIVFVVQQSHTQSPGFERIAMELSKALSHQYTCTLKVIPAPALRSSMRSHRTFLSFFYSLKHFFLCLKYANQGDVLYFFGKKTALSFPFIRLITKKKIFSQIQYLPQRLSGKRGIARIWERLQERLALNFANKVFVDSPRAQAYFNEEFKRKPAMTFYGADHIEHTNKVAPIDMLQNNRKYAITYMPNSPQQALMALRSFAQYPKYDYYFLLEKGIGSLPEEIRKFGAYDHIHLCEKDQIPSRLFADAYIYFHLEPTVSARIRLIEAMKAGKFTLCFDTDFSRNLTRSEALYFNNHSQLISCLHRAVTQSHFDQGNRMKTLANSLSWRTVAENVSHHIEEMEPKELAALSLESSKFDL